MSSAGPQRERLKNVIAKELDKRLRKLSKDDADRVRKTIERWDDNDFARPDTHPLKNTKASRAKHGSVSVRVRYCLRAIFLVDGDQRIWYWAGTHEDYNNFVGKR